MKNLSTIKSYVAVRLVIFVELLHNPQIFKKQNKHLLSDMYLRYIRA